ncbi:MAG TPA: hypothetical protein VFR23_24540 [Jiangellaceae bacterium]|nr:hypothetical protein [Jiangellaceae bacterium]
MNNAASRNYEMTELYMSGCWVVRCLETGTETIPMSRARAARVLRALRGQA